MGLIKNEICKQFDIKFIFKIIVVLFIMNIVLCIYYNKTSPNPSDWKKNACNKKIELTNEYNRYKAQGYNENSEKMKNIDGEIKIIDYSLKNNIPYDYMQAIEYLRNFLGIANVLILFIFVIHFVSSMKEEYISNTWKSMILTGKSRVNILLSKFFSNVLAIILYLVIVVIIALIVGTFYYGFDVKELCVWYENSKILWQLEIFKMIKGILFSTFSVGVMNLAILMLAYIIFQNQYIVMVLGGILSYPFIQFMCKKIPIIRYFNILNYEGIKYYLLIFFYIVFCMCLSCYLFCKKDIKTS